MTWERGKAPRPASLALRAPSRAPLERLSDPLTASAARGPGGAR